MKKDWIKKFITYDLKIKGNTPYHILLIEVSLSPIENMAMFRYLLYKKKFYNMEGKKFPKIVSISSQNPHLRLKRAWHKDVQVLLDHCRIKEDIILENKDNIKNTITSKFKDKLWDDEELKRKGTLRYYKEVMNPTLTN